MHTKAKHPESHKESRLSNKQKRKMKTYGIILLIILVIGGLYYWRSIPPKNAPIIEIEPSIYNFGPVSQAGGVVSAMMMITNVGTENLIINNMDTSCGCTSASIVFNEVEGPKFGMSMHGTNPKNWRQIIPPGESAELKVYYDPNVHKTMRGPVTRTASIYSNDPRNKVMMVTIKANQVD